MWAKTDYRERQKVMQDAINGDVFMGAKNIFGQNGLHPTYWGISKQQFQLFVDEVRDYYLTDQMTNEFGNEPTHKFYYPPEVFNDERRGPNMHQICSQIIKPRTMDFHVMIDVDKKQRCTANPEGNNTLNIPFLSYSLQQNFYSAGLLCEVFFSHAWDEPFFEAASRILGDWPDDCEGAYICSLCNPQNLDIGSLLGSTIENSPFYRILTASSSPPRELLMVANSQTPIHQRLWCVLEANVALSRSEIFRVKMTGQAHHLLTNDDAKTIKTQIDLFLGKMTLLIQEAEILATTLATKKINSNDYWLQAQEIQNRIDAIRQSMHEAQAKVLSRPDDELINLTNATTSYKQDESMIREFISGSELRICTMVADLLRNHIRNNWKEEVLIAEEKYASTQAEVVSKYAGLQDVITTGEVARDRHKSRAGLTEWMQKAFHVIPVGLVQFSDYVSDIIVVIQLYRLGGFEWVIAVTAMVFSLLLGWLMVLYVRIKKSEKVIMFLLAPLNLHTLYFGFKGTGDPHDRAVFAMLKGIESITESAILAVLTFSALVQGNVNDNIILFMASLGLSVLSMSYSFTMLYTRETTYIVDPLRIFCCTLVNVCYEVAAIGFVIGLAPGIRGWLAFAAYCLVNGAITTYTIRTEMDCSSDNRYFTLRGLAVFSSSLMLSMFDAALCCECTKEEEVYAPVFRRVTLLPIVIYAIILSPSPAVISILISLFAADVLSLLLLLRSIVSWRWNRQCEVDPNPTTVVFEKWTGCNFEYLNSIVAQLLVYCPPKVNHKEKEEQIATGNEQIDANCSNDVHTIVSSSMVLSVMLDAILLEPGDRHNTLLVICERIKLGVAEFPSKLSLAAHAGALQALHAYRPKVIKEALNEILLDTDDPDLRLLQALQECVSDNFLPGPVPDTIQMANEQFRVIHLAAVPHVWETLVSKDSPLDLTTDSNECDYFVSHARGVQDEIQTMAIVNDFIFVQALLSSVTVMLIVIGLFMIPLGAAINSEVPSIPFWVLSIAVDITLILVWIWVLLAKHTSLVPQRLRPWALSQRTLWIDRYCISHSTQAGMYSTGRFIAQSNNMIAVVNKNYFTNLQCVYELAIFCKVHQGSKLEDRLVLISSEWGKIYWFHTHVTLMSAEIKWLKEFRCDEARCAVPAERQIIVSAIREVWGSLADFEQFVSRELLHVLDESKQRHYRRPKQIMGEALKNVFAG